MKTALRSRITEFASTSLWLIPATSVCGSLILAAALARVDHGIVHDSEAWYLFGGNAESAHVLLSTIATSLLTLTGLSFSITIVVLQVASTQFSSRVLRTFLEDKYTQFTMATFIGSFVLAIVVLLQVRDPTDRSAGFVPALSVFIVNVLTIVCVGVFIRYIHHMAHSIRVVHVVARVADDTRRSMERMYPSEAAEPMVDIAPPATPPDQAFAHDRAPGVIVSIDEGALYRLACERDVIISVVPYVGDFVPRGAPLFRVWGRAALGLPELRDCVEVGPERTPFQDPAFGFRQLVDVGERALSPGINDPTSAVQALDQIHDLLRALATRPFPAPVRVDQSGRLRLVLPRPDWDSYVHLAFDEIREYGSRSIQVTRRLRAVIIDLLSIVPSSRSGVLREELTLIDEAVERGFPSALDRQIARRPSSQGHGQE